MPAGGAGQPGEEATSSRPLCQSFLRENRRRDEPGPRRQGKSGTCPGSDPAETRRRSAPGVNALSSRERARRSTSIVKSDSTRRPGPRQQLSRVFSPPRLPTHEAAGLQKTQGVTCRDYWGNICGSRRLAPGQSSGQDQCLSFSIRSVLAGSRWASSASRRPLACPPPAFSGRSRAVDPQPTRRSAPAKGRALGCHEATRWPVVDRARPSGVAHPRRVVRRRETHRPEER